MGSGRQVRKFLFDRYAYIMEQNKAYTWSKIFQILKVPEEYIAASRGIMFPEKIIHVEPINFTEKDTRNNDIGPGDTLESDLLDVGESTIKSSQLIGYLPLCIISSPDQRRRQLSFQPKSFPFIWSIFLSIIQLVVFALWYRFFASQIFTILKIKRATEKFALGMSGLLTTYMIFGRRAYGLIFYKQPLKFWSEFVSSLKKIEGPAGTESIFKSSIFIRIKLSISRTVTVNCMATSIFALYFVSTFAFSHAAELEKPGGHLLFFVHMIVSTMWNVYQCLHFFMTAWTTFPLKIVQGLLETLKGELDQELSETKLKKSPQLRQTWIQDYRKISEILKLYTRHFEKSLISEIAYNSVQILCQCFSGFSWILSGMISPTISRSIPVMLGLRTLYQLSNEAENVSVLHGEIYERLCRIEVDLDNEEMRLMVI